MEPEGRLSTEEIFKVDNLELGIKVFSPNPLTSQSARINQHYFNYQYEGNIYASGQRGMENKYRRNGKDLNKAGRLMHSLY
jgi:hypothetical protein